MTTTDEMEPYQLLERMFFLQQCLVFGNLTEQQREKAEREINELEAAMRTVAEEVK